MVGWKLATAPFPQGERTPAEERQAPEPLERLERLMVRDAVLIASNSSMRVGELWQLKWGDIERIAPVIDANEKRIQLATLNVRGETSKTRNSRRIMVRGGEYFLRLKGRSTHTGPDDFVFSAIDGNA